MKVLKIVLITLVLCSVGILTLSCASNSSSTPAAQNQVATVQQGNLEVDITASGNLTFSHTEDLAFQMAGIVAEVNVQEGDSVKQGQVLATLDTSQRETDLASLESRVLSAQISLKNDQLALDKAEDETVTLVTGDIVYATNYDDEEIAILKLRVKLDEANLQDAQKALTDAQNASPEIIAPFDGFISTVNVSAGDAGTSGNGVPKGTVACQIVDPSKFQADILVSEMDIFQVKVGGDASVQLSSIPGVSLPAKVTYISPTATIQQGVVNYKVTVEIQPLEVPTQGEVTPSSPLASSTVPQNLQLREGLTVTVSIIVAQRTGVLLVPNGAITTRGRQTYVQVVSADGTTQERAITTGISNWQYTEVTEGLSEGEQVVVPQGTTTTSTTTQERGGMPFFGPPSR
jgi:RND family efflux transporter MFP subunit